MITIRQKEDIFQAWEAAEKRGVKKSRIAKEVESQQLPGYFPGCVYPSKWGRVREEQQWPLLCESAPALCSKHRELPNSLRGILQLTMKHATHHRASTGAQSMPWVLKEVVESMLMERLDCGEELGITYVKNTIIFAAGIWNECIESVKDVVQTILSKHDDRLAGLSAAELEEKFKSMSEIAEKLLRRVELSETDGALTNLAD